MNRNLLMSKFLLTDQSIRFGQQPKPGAETNRDLPPARVLRGFLRGFPALDTGPAFVGFRVVIGSLRLLNWKGFSLFCSLKSSRTSSILRRLYAQLQKGKL